MALKLVSMLKNKRKCDPTVRFLKYELNNKLLVGVKIFRVTSSVTWPQRYISYFDVNFDKSIVRLHYLHMFFMYTKFQGDQRLLGMSSINCLNSTFCHLK